MSTTNAEGNSLQSISILLDEQQLAEQVSFDTIREMQIMEQVQGQYLDYPFSVCIEQITQTGIIFSCQCCPPIDEMLYTPINYEISQSDLAWVENGEYHVEHTSMKGDYICGVLSTSKEYDYLVADVVKACPASMHINYIANALGISTVWRFNDFVSSIAVEQKNVTYADLISSLFGWTSRIETQMIHAFLRNNVLYIIQRGHEENLIDLTNTKHSMPVITRQIVRKTWAAGSDDQKFNLHTHQIQNSLYVHKANANSNFTKKDDDTDYDYDGTLLKSKTTKTKDADGKEITTKTTYHYKTYKGYKYLAREEETTTDADDETSTRKTIHTPLGNGQMETRVYVDGEFVSSSTGPGIKNSEPSQKTLNEESEYVADIVGSIENDYDKGVIIPGNSLIDTSIPVYGQGSLMALTEALKDMNRKTQETLSIDVYNYEHLIDFNDRIIFNGAEYFLKSNKAEKSVVNRIENKQSIQLVRWY